MKYFTTLQINKNNQSDLFNKLFAFSCFANQKWFSEYNIYVKNLQQNNIDTLYSYIFANKDIKIKSIDNINYNFPQNLNEAKLVACSLHNEPFCFIDSRLLILNNEKINNIDSEFAFFSEEKSKLKYYKYGLEFLNEIGSPIDELKEFTIQNVNFPIYNTYFLLCNNNELYNKYLYSLKQISLKASKINEYFSNITSNYKRTFYLKSLSMTLENLLLSKILNQDNARCVTINNIDNKFLKFPPQENDYSILKGNAEFLENKNFINQMYEDIKNNNYCSIKDYISNFLGNDQFVSKTSWGQELKNSFLNEKNSGGGCSSCKLKRISRKYDEIVRNKFQ